MAFKRDYSILK